LCTKAPGLSSLEPGGSQTFENIASAGPFDLTIVTREREFRFQLKQALAESPYNELWRKLNRSRESAFLQSTRH